MGLGFAVALAFSFVLAGLPSRCDAQEIPVRVTVEPRVASLGERVSYHAYAVLPAGVRTAKWLPLEEDEDITWGELVPSRVAGPVVHDTRQPPSRDTLHLRTSLQVFRTGSITIPGVRFQIEDTDPPVVHRLPEVTFEIVSALPADGSKAELQPARGPLEAPWWERVPWRWVLLGLALIAAAVTGVILWRRRGKPADVVVPAPVADPVADALRALAALRGQGLPEGGRFAEHAFILSGIAKRFLEATARTPQPGDTTPELIAHLRSSSLSAEDLKRVEGLLRIWDRVKFARAPSTAAEAARAEAAVEALVRRREPTLSSEQVA